ncbi:hypothetical protein [Jatrophihabitans sp.]|uniref:hypothetical protein n=1 Tax=Jatrophihabitans sp. TaxID=1932789 RepID=UPI002C5D254A|nr:hypothetical protein [Jatrophihabitans sp.]
MSDMGSGGFVPPPVTGAAQAAGMADAKRQARDHRRLHSAENEAELKAMRPSRFAGLRQLLGRLRRRG